MGEVSPWDGQPNLIYGLIYKVLKSLVLTYVSPYAKDNQVVDEFIHVDITIDTIKHLFKTNINSECRVPPFPPAGMK